MRSTSSSRQGISTRLERSSRTHQPRPALETVLRDMQRSMERLTDMVAAIHAELRQMQQERSRSVPATPPHTQQERASRTQQPRSMEQSRRSPQTRTHVPGYDPEAAAVRIGTLRSEGLSLTQIAERLNQEGVPTRRGLPWKKALVGWFLKHHEQ